MMHGQPNIKYQILLRVIVLFPSTTVKIFKFYVILCFSFQCPADWWFRCSSFTFKRLKNYIWPISCVNGSLNCANREVNGLSKVVTPPESFAAKTLLLCHKIISMHFIINKDYFYNKPELLCYCNLGGGVNLFTYFPAHKTHFLPEKCDVNSTCVLCAEGKYYFRTFKYPYIYYTS
jgi:hypothetical protein